MDANTIGQGKKMLESFYSPGKSRGSAESYRAEIASWGSHEVTAGRKRKGMGQAAMGWGRRNLRDK